MPYHNCIKINEGDRYNSFVFIRATLSKGGNRCGIFRCDCGKETEIAINRITNGYSKTCGCSNKVSKIRHGHAANGKTTKTYEAWTSMRKRCLNESHKSYKDYGGRGIKICDRWSLFENFLDDMGEAEKGCSLDRIKNSGDYEPSNCRWVTMIVQNNNKRSNTILHFNGISKTLSQWADYIGIKDCTLSERIRSGWSVERALTMKTDLTKSHRKANL